MSRTPDCMYRASETLSEVMDNIGVNETLVMKRRRAWLLMEKISTWISVSLYNSTSYKFGSQSEGSTTEGLGSDQDTLMNMNTHNIIQNMSERKPGDVNLMIIQNENISPGYCYLQLIRPDLPLPATVSDIDDEMMEFYVTDGEGRFLLKNTFATREYGQINFHGRKHIHGPALTYLDSFDLVASYCCKSSPHQVTSWLQKQRGSKWPTEGVLEKCRNVGCFVVPVGSKVAYIPELEWRISTSLQERYLMFSLNITQLRCYILMKMILKTHIDPKVEDVLSSYMCKNVLWYCIANSSHDWHTGNLLSYLHLCLFMLKECVEQRNCPHFMISENNLLAGGMTDKQRGEILDIINKLMITNEQLLFDIQIDHLGKRLKKLTEHEVNGQDIQTATEISQIISCELVYETAGCMSGSLSNILIDIYDRSLEMVQENLFETLSILEIDKLEGELKYLQTACTLLIALASSTSGSVQASPNIASNMTISDEALYNLHNACALLIPLASSTLGSVPASSDIASHTAISDEALYNLRNACALLKPLASSTSGSVPASPNIASNMAISDEALYNLHNACALLIPLASSTLGSVQASPNIASYTAISDEALYLRSACALLIPLVKSTLGSVQASSNIASHTAISDQAFTYLVAGKESDALSGRLKLVSVLYCTGDMNRTECELRNIQKLYNMSLVETVCACNIKLQPYEDKQVWKACADDNEVSIKSHVAVCTRFLQCEINCVPQELRYEILRSYIDRDRQMETDDESKYLWIVDSIPYHYFLQYRTYGQLQRRKEQEEALSNLQQSISSEPNLGHKETALNLLGQQQSISSEPHLGHKETALNLLGQCMEQENMQTEAFQCYIRSLKHLRRNNAASFLLCIQLSKIWKQDNSNHRQNGPPRKRARRDSPDFKCC